MPENNFQFVCGTKGVPVGEARAFSIRGISGGNTEIAVFNLAGKFYAISNVCIHKGGPLSKGTLSNDIVTCPWHGWKYSVKNGKSPHEGGDSVNSYPVEVSEDRVYVSPLAASVGKKISKPHAAYRMLGNNVKQHIANTSTSQALPIDASVRVLGISATNMNDDKTPRKSTSEEAL